MLCRNLRVSKPSPPLFDISGAGTPTPSGQSLPLLLIQLTTDYYDLEMMFCCSNR